MEKDRLVIGTRGSPLALWQANWVRSLLLERHPKLQVEIRVIKTSGDKIQDVPLNKIGGKGLFVKEIEEAMLRKEVDIAVHSMKDVPMKLPFGLNISVITERESPFDALVSRKGLPLAEIPEGGRIGTGSLRRMSQLKHHRPDLEMVPLRGNVGTRLDKMEREGLDGIILAASGLHRMGLDDRITEIIDPEILLPAMGQGSVGIEARVYDHRVQELIVPLDHEVTHFTVEAERAFVEVLEGGCQVPIGAYATLEGGVLTVRGRVASLDGALLYKWDRQGPPADAKKLGRELGRDLLKMGADKILDELIGPSETR